MVWERVFGKWVSSQNGCGLNPAIDRRLFKGNRGVPTIERQTSRKEQLLFWSNGIATSHDQTPLQMVVKSKGNFPKIPGKSRLGTLQGINISP